MLKTQSIFNHLSKHVNNAIEIYDPETTDQIVPKITLSQIENQAENLDVYFKDLGDKFIGINEFGVQLFNSNGSTYTRIGYPITVAINHSKKDMPKEVASTGKSATTQPEVAPPATQVPNYLTPDPAHQMQQQAPYFGNPNMGLMGASGLSMPDLISLHTKAERYTDIKEQLFDVKDLLRKESEKNGLLTIDLREAQSKLAVSQQVKDLAVQAAEMNNKGLMESQGFKEIIAQIGKIAPSLIQNQQPGGGLAGAQQEENYSDDKTGLMNLIKDDNFSDQIAIKLVYVAIGLQKMPKFDTDLGTLVDKYKIKESVN
ncbi:MAG: hypothetical protein JKY30_10910 [Flavobacteriales bacterium]|nr:hypothetical protein [Flavobacteriales bacterium]